MGGAFESAFSNFTPDGRGHCCGIEPEAEQRTKNKQGAIARQRPAGGERDLREVYPVSTGVVHVH